MQNNMGSNRISFDIINEVCKELLEENKIEKNVIQNIRNDWISNFENLCVTAGQMQNYEEEQNMIDETFSEENSDDWSEDSDIARAEENQRSYLVCLFLKVTKSKGKWKCVFKDGFVNVEGYEDHPFNNATGELEW